MGHNGQYHDRLTRQDCRAIRRAMRRVQGVTLRIEPVAMLNADEVVVTSGDVDWQDRWSLRRIEDGWEVAERVRVGAWMTKTD